MTDFLLLCLYLLVFYAEQIAVASGLGYCFGLFLMMGCGGLLCLWLDGRKK